jgi:hypothetical protein
MDTAVVITIVGIISATNIASITIVATLLGRRIDDVNTLLGGRVDEVGNRVGGVEHGLQEVRDRLTTLEVKLGER